ncbi:MAG: outer membrane protein assembly factor BamD [Pseudomonadota bacterium]
MRNILALFFIIVSLMLTACGLNTPDDPATLYKNYSAKQLYDKGGELVRAGYYKDGAKYFEGLNALYPFSTYAEKGTLDLIYAYYKSQDYASAIATSTEFIHLYPRDKNADYAYYMKALSEINQNRNFFQRVFPVDMSYRDLDNAKQAFFDFRDLVQLYPRSRYAPDAKQHMIFLRNMFARHEMQVARYYYVRKAYVAAANRATYVVQNYQGSTSMPQALAMLVKTNRKLGLTKSANDALRVLQANYPNSESLRRLARV